MLDLSPETESRLFEYAASEGVDANEAVKRLLKNITLKRQPDPKALALAATIREWQAEDATEDDDELNQRDQERAALQASLDESRQQAGMHPLFPERG